MLPIILHPEPPYFNEKIRIPGNNWLRLNSSPRRFKNLWRNCLKDMHKQYNGICCYYVIYIELDSGTESIDHFAPKSKYADKAYEWTNFRFCCIQANRRKQNYEDVIDPISLEKDILKLDFGTGEIFYDETISSVQKALLDSTIFRLKLNNPALCQMRKSNYAAYLRDELTPKGLAARSPFVYHEAVRQGLISL